MWSPTSVMTESRAMSDNAQSDLHANRREQILTAAGQCIREVGFDQVRLRDVSRTSGVSIGLIQHYFETRDGLLEEAAAHQSDLLIERLDVRTENIRGWRRLEALFDELYGLSDLTEHAKLWVALGAAAMRHPELAPRRQSIHRAWRKLVAEAVHESVAMGEIASVSDLDHRIASLLAFFDGYEFQVAIGDIPPDTDDFRRRAQIVTAALFGYRMTGD